MERFQTFGGALSAALEQIGAKDDNGKLIKGTEKPLPIEEYLKIKERELKEKSNKFHINEKG